MNGRRVVVTGLGAVSPLGLTLEDTWQGIAAGKSGVGTIAGFDASTFPVQIAAEVDGFSVDPYVSKRDTRRVISRAAGFGLGAAKMAWQDAGLDGADDCDHDRVGVMLGSCLTAPSLPETNAWLRIYDDGIAPEKAFEDPFAFVRRASHTGTSQIASEIGARGPTSSVYVACASGTQAIGMALNAIRRGEADVVLTGAYDSMVSEWYILLFALINALSTRNSDPRRASRPFDKDRDGFVMGEGAAMLVLEDAEHALSRGAHIHAEVLGYGSSLDAYHITDAPPEGEGAVAAMTDALQDAGIAPHEIDYINAHGTSTRDNDVAETQAIKTVLGEDAYRTAVSSTKSMTGHLISAAGALEACLCVCALRDGLMPPTINLDAPDPECDLDYVSHRARRAEIRTALSNSFGFGGSNGSLVLRRG
jgi:3-oxoacyl-[acyl-carrier-protein] synthase II